MQIHRVVRDLVTTRRVGMLQAKKLKVLVDAKGELDVAVDPIGCKPGDYVISIGYSAARIAAGDPRVTTDLTIGGIIDHWSEEEWRR
ncbi:MAG: carboxysome peptide B [Geminicoccaceae bacterium]|nr:carboxysome peptide B [Geminicoccaceae bacterium]